MKKWNPRKSYVFVFLACLFYANFTSGSNLENRAAIDKKIKTIEERIKLPHIPNKSKFITDFGAVADGQTNCKPAIDKAIDQLSESGGGKIIFPKGIYFCKGPIHLKSHMQLHFEDGATILFSDDYKDYLPLQFVRWEGVECYNFSPCIYANGITDIAITGKGILNGNSNNGMAKWLGKQKPAQMELREMGKNLVPLEKRVFGVGKYLRPSFLQLMNCENILISDIKITNVPFWVIHPTYCKNVTIQNVTIDCDRLNNDGIDMDSSKDGLIEGCHFINAGDDAIAIKSGRDADAWRVNKPSKNIVIRNCLAENVLHGLAFGSEMSGGIENIYINNFIMKNVEKYAIQFKANKDRGGYIKNVFIDGVYIDTSKTAIFFTNNYHGYKGGNAPTEFHHVSIKNVICKSSYEKGIDIVGLQEKKIHHLELENIQIINEKQESLMENTENIFIDNVRINGKPIKL